MIHCVLAAGLFLSAHAASSPAPELRPAIEVSASSGPVRLILRLHKTKLKVGESLWHQIGIQNAGAKPLLVTNSIFFAPETIEHEYLQARGIRVEVLGPDGKPLQMTPGYVRYPHDDIRRKPSGSLEVDSPELQHLAIKWRKQGLSEREIKLKVIAYHDERRRSESTEQTPDALLKPGQSIWTKSWFYHNAIEQRRGAAEPEPLGDYAELDFFSLDRPGVYKVRAVYDLSTSRDELKRLASMGIPIDRRVKVTTKWVAVELAR